MAIVAAGVTETSSTAEGASGQEPRALPGTSATIEGEVQN